MTWAIEQKDYSQRRACRLVGVEPKTYRYRSRRNGDDPLRRRLQELAAERRRFGYRRLLILRRREGLLANHKRLYRIYTEERLTVRKRGGRKRALGSRAPMTVPQAANQRWSLDFASDVLDDGRRFRVLVVVDDFSRECLVLAVDSSLSGHRVARELDRLVELRGRPLQIVNDNGTELTSHAILRWEPTRGLALHCAGQADAERLRREPDWPTAGRMPQRASVPQPARGPADDRALAGRLQHPAPPYEPRGLTPVAFANRSSLDHNPIGLCL